MRTAPERAHRTTEAADVAAAPNGMDVSVHGSADGDTALRRAADSGAGSSEPLVSHPYVGSIGAMAADLSEPPASRPRMPG